MARGGPIARVASATLLLVTAALVVACGLPGVPQAPVAVGTGVTWTGETWRAELRAAPDGTTCLAIMVAGRTTDRGCSWKDPGEGLRVDPDGFAIATTDKPTVTQGRLRLGDGTVAMAGAAPGQPLSSMTYVIVALPVAPGTASAAAFNLELLDRQGATVLMLAR